MPYSGYTSAEVCRELRRSRQSLFQAGIFEKLRPSYPFGPQFPLYDEGDVTHWKLNLLRHDALLAFGRRDAKASLLSAASIEDWIDYDGGCPKCGGVAFGDPEANAEDYLALLNSDKWPRRVWCPKCGLISV